MICNDCYFIIEKENKKYCQHSFSNVIEILQEVIKCPHFEDKLGVRIEENSN
jgi:hypothetical protein